MHQLETKSAHADDLDSAFDDFMRAFEAFKDSQRRAPRPARAPHVGRRRHHRQARPHRPRARRHTSASSTSSPSSPRGPHLGGPALRSGAALQHKAAFDGYVRKGEAAHLRDLESKALSVGSDPDGGFLVPDELERAVNRAVQNVSPIRAIAGIRQVSGSVYKKPFAITGAESGWVAETAARPETDTPTLAELSFPTMELYAMPAATSALLDDCGRQHRRVDRRGGARRLRPAGRHRLRHRQRHQQAEGLPRLHQGRQRHLELGQHRLHQDRRERRLCLAPTPATS